MSFWVAPVTAVLNFPFDLLAILGSKISSIGLSIFLRILPVIALLIQVGADNTASGHVTFSHVTVLARLSGVVPL